MHNDFREQLALARRGDNVALGKILEAVEDRLRRATQKRLGQRLRGKIQTSDVLQTTYLDIVRSIRDFDGDNQETFAAWVTRVLENNLRDKAKFFERDKRRDATTTDSSPTNDLAEPVADGMTPSQEVMQVEHLHVVARALDMLEESQRRVIVARMLHGRDYADIAQEIGKSEGAVRMLFSRARAALALNMDRLLDDT